VREKGSDVQVLFLDASDESLVRRYSETRRRHPLAGDSGTVPDGIAAERQALADLKAIADEVIDTTPLNVHELKRLVTRRFFGGESARLGVTLVSFGFRYGIPTHADMVLDVRFLPNPYFVPELKPYPGTDPRVSEFVLAQPDAKAFLERLVDLCGFLLPRYRAEGKSYLTLAIGCTGGKHRSVALSAVLASRLEAGGQPVRLWHRDVEKE
jgi:RNase adapter protein RapZ